MQKCNITPKTVQLKSQWQNLFLLPGSSASFFDCATAWKQEVDFVGADRYVLAEG